MRLKWIVGALTLTATPAFADAGSTVFPCPDGWAACEVDGERIEPVGRTDTKGRPQPSDTRVSWFDLEATTTFSPFQRVTAYVAPAREPAPVVRPVPPPAPPVPDVAPPSQVDVPDTPSQPEQTADEVPPAPAPVEPPAVVDVEPPAPEVDQPPAEVVATAEDDIQTPDVSSVDDPLDDDAGDDTDEVVDQDGVAKVEIETPPCPSLVDMEPHALLGTLTQQELVCAEQDLAQATRQTDKDKASRLLIANAYSSGDTEGWAALLENHLETIDQSDPAMVYRYALYQQREGHPAQAIRWSEVALENRTIWTGGTYVRNVNGLYKLRAAAGQSRWKAATQRYEAAPDAETSAEADQLRARAKVYAREWLEYTRQAGLDSTVAYDLCVSAAGTTSYCDAP